ncbi:MAG: glutathione synthase [Bacteroidales bacterium]|nr:glutathione synthase [Bacteroidales bacterium]
MNICFIMDQWESIDVEIDSTLRMIHEAALRKHTVGILYPSNLTMQDSISKGFFKMVRKEEIVAPTPIQFYKKVKFIDQLLPLSGFDVIFLRADPPIDNIMLNFLDSVKNDTFIINDIEGIREANNKLYTAAFYDPNNEIIPVTFVSKNKDYLKQIITECSKNKMILKPLNGFGGRGVIVLEKNAVQNINSLLDFYIHGKDESNYVIIQEYVEGADEGDVRVILLNGEPIGSLKRVPAKGDVRSNIHAGGHAIKHTLTKEEIMICKKIGPKLVADGLYLAGIDIINGKIIEVNVTSPGGFPMVNKFMRKKIQEDIIDFVEDVVAQRKIGIDRKLEFQKTVDNA